MHARQIIFQMPYFFSLVITSNVNPLSCIFWWIPKALRFSCQIFSHPEEPIFKTGCFSINSAETHAKMRKMRLPKMIKNYLQRPVYCKQSVYVVLNCISTHKYLLHKGEKTNISYVLSLVWCKSLSIFEGLVFYCKGLPHL